MRSHQTEASLGKVLPLLCALALPACERKEHTLGAEYTAEEKNALERVVYTQKVARVEYTTSAFSSIIKDLKLTLPQGKFAVSIYKFELSGSEGTDSIKGAEKVFEKAFTSNGTEGPVPIEIKEFSASRMIMIISGSGQQGALQQTILFNADKENQISPITYE